VVKAVEGCAQSKTLARVIAHDHLVCKRPPFGALRQCALPAKVNSDATFVVAASAA
jgi:hypothetical protein